MTTATRYLRNNVLGLTAIFIALTAGAYAAGLKADSVKSKHIKDGQVQNDDLGAGAVDASKVAGDSLGGAQINESSLAQVPSALNAANATSAASATNASQLGGQGPAAFQQRVSGACTGAQAVQSIAVDGSVGCGGGGGSGTTYSAAANGGLALTGTAFRLTSCTSGQVLKATGATTWACAADNAGGPPSGAATGDLTGNYPNPQIANNAIAGPELAANSVTSNAVADNSLTTTDVNESTLTKVPAATAADTASSLGPPEAWHEVAPGSSTSDSCTDPSATAVFCTQHIGGGSYDLWFNYGAPHATAAFYKDQLGIVHLKGLVRSVFGGGGTPTNPVRDRIFRLPAAYRPATLRVFASVGSVNFADQAVAAARVDVQPDGEVQLVSDCRADSTGCSALGDISLDGITFRPAG